MILFWPLQGQMYPFTWYVGPLWGPQMYPWVSNIYTDIQGSCFYTYQKIRTKWEGVDQRADHSFKRACCALLSEHMEIFDRKENRTRRQEARYQQNKILSVPVLKVWHNVEEKESLTIWIKRLSSQRERLSFKSLGNAVPRVAMKWSFVQAS